MNILITGEHSYIGTSFMKYIQGNSEISSKRYNWITDTLSLKNDDWRTKDLSIYDVVLHTAAIVHRPDISENDTIYFDVNTKLTKEFAEYCTAFNIKHFIFLSTMNVYGRSSGAINPTDIPTPNSSYGKSKYLAELELSKIFNNTSTILSIIRPPMVYGYDCPGNYMRLSKLVDKVPIFPKTNNIRSMIYIDNLLEFMCQLIERELAGTYCPQNREYVNTSKLVKHIAVAKGHNIVILPGFAPVLNILSNHISTINKIAGSLYYLQDPAITFDYSIVDFSESIKRSK